MKKNLKTFSYLSLVLLVASLNSCAIYPNVPEHYLSEGESASSEQTEGLSLQETRKNYPNAKLNILNQFSETEKAILVSQAYEVYGLSAQVDSEKIKLYPDLKKHGNFVSLTAHYLPMAESTEDFPYKKKQFDGWGGNLLDNIAFAAQNLTNFSETPEFSKERIQFLTLKIKPLEMMLLIKPQKWTELVGGTPFLSLERVGYKVLYRRYLLNRHFREFQWSNMLSGSEEESFDTLLLVDNWLRFSSAQEDSSIPGEKEMEDLTQVLLSKVRAYDDKLSYVSDKDGGFNLSQTISPGINFRLDASILIM